MATDAIVLEHADSVDLGTGMTPIVQLAPLQPGRSYVIAKLSGGARVFSGSPATGLSVAKNAKLVVLAVDSVVVQAA